MVRILIFALLATTGVVPLPWGHSHQGMPQSELSRHHQQFHLTESTEEMPTGWHWHFYHSRKLPLLAANPMSDPLAGIGLQQVDGLASLYPLKSLQESVFSDRQPVRFSQVALGPKIYLRLLVLRN